MISAAHFENASNVLETLDILAILSAKDRMEKNPEAIRDFLLAMAQGGKAKAYRKLAALANATLDEVLTFETDAKALAAAELAQAKRPFVDVFRDAVGFFSSLLPGSTGIPASSPSESAEGSAVVQASDVTPFGAS